MFAKQITFKRVSIPQQPLSEWARNLVKSWSSIFSGRVIALQRES